MSWSWSSKVFFMVMVFFGCLLLLATPLSLSSWFSCHINVCTNILLIVVVVGGCGVCFLVTPHHCLSISLLSSSSSSYGFGCPNHRGHCGILIATTNSCPPSLWSSWSCGLGHHCGLLFVVANSWPPLPLWSSWFFSFGYHYHCLVVATNSYSSLPFWSWCFCSCSRHCHSLSF